MKHFQLLLSISLLLHCHAHIITRRQVLLNDVVESQVNSENGINSAEIKTSTESLKLLEQKYIIEPLPTEAKSTADDVDDFAYDKVYFENTAEEKENTAEENEEKQPEIQQKLQNSVEDPTKTENVPISAEQHPKTENVISPLEFPKDFLRPIASAAKNSYLPKETKVQGTSPEQQPETINTDKPLSFPKELLKPTSNVVNNSKLPTEEVKKISLNGLPKTNNLETILNSDSEIKTNAETVSNSIKNEGYNKEENFHSLNNEYSNESAANIQIANEEVKVFPSAEEYPEDEDPIAMESTKPLKEVKLVLSTEDDLKDAYQTDTESTNTIKEEIKFVARTEEKLKSENETKSSKIVEEEVKFFASTEKYFEDMEVIKIAKSEVIIVESTEGDLADWNLVAAETVKEAVKPAVSTEENSEDANQIASEEDAKSVVSSEDKIEGSHDSSELFIANVPPRRTNLNKTQNSTNSSAVEIIVPPSLIQVASTEDPTTTTTSTTNTPTTVRPFRPWFSNLLRPGANSFLNRRNITTANHTQTIFGMGLLLVPENLPNFLRPRNFTRFPIQQQQQQQSTANVDLTRHVAYNNSVWNGTDSVQSKPLFKPYFFNSTVAAKNATTFKRKPWTFMKSGYNTTGGAATSEHNQQQRHHNNGALPTAAAIATTAAAAATIQVENPLDNATARQRFATLSLSNNRSSSCRIDNQLVNRPLCRTPPPVYNAAAVQALPATPPPSYTQHNVLYQFEEQQFATAAEPEVLPLAGRRHVGRAPLQQQQPRVVCAQVDEASVVEHRRQLATCGFVVTEVEEQEENATNRNEPRIATTTATTQSSRSTSSLSQQQQQQQQRRRRRLQLLQQQHFSNINATSTDSSNSSHSDSEADFAATISGLQRRRPRHALRGDAYCPDLLHACALILQQPPTSTSASSVGSFTETLSYSADSDYVEIDDIHPVSTSSHRSRDYDNLRLRVRSTPELRRAAPEHATEDEDGNGTATAAKNTPHLERSVYRPNKRREAQSQEMGQNLSLRRPRISLTWVLREQQQQQQPQAEQQKDEKDTNNTAASNFNPLPSAETQNNNNGYINGHEAAVKPLAPPTHLIAPKKRYRVKQLPGSSATHADPLNGYATTPTAHTAATNAAEMPHKFFSNQNLLDYKTAEKTRRAPSRELLFVCTPQRLPKSATSSYDNCDALALAKKRNEIRKKLAAKMAALQANSRAADGAESAVAAAQSSTTTVSNVNGGGGVLGNDELKSLKGTYSEPSLIAASEGNHHRRHRHRKRRERNRVQKFGYEIRNVDEFLTKCSLASPGNIPVVLSNASTLYQTRPGGYQVEIPLPLGMVVNAVFKNQNWLYVQTPHAEEGYVGYACCLPLGILPPAARGGSTRPTPCWESNGDVFPRPCGNMTDSEKEIRLRGGTRSDGARTPRGKRGNAAIETAMAVVPKGVAPETTDAVNGNTSSQYGEHHVDKLYLRATSQPRLVEKAYAQLKSTKAASLRSAGNDEYVTLQQKSKQHVRHHMQQQQLQQQQLQQQKPVALLANSPPYITNGHNGQHLHPKNALVAPQTVLAAVRKQQAAGLRQTLVAISADYAAEGIALQKGEIVTLCECRESKDQRQWFYVKTRDGREGYIPAEVAGHGYL